MGSRNAVIAPPAVNIDQKNGSFERAIASSYYEYKTIQVSTPDAVIQTT